MDILIRMKDDGNHIWEKYHNISKISSELDDGFYSPFEEIIMLVVMIVGVGGGGKIVVELIKHCSKSVKIKYDHFDNLEVDCTNCSVKEVMKILQALNDMSEKEKQSNSEAQIKKSPK